MLGTGLIFWQRGSNEMYSTGVRTGVKVAGVGVITFLATGVEIEVITFLATGAGVGIRVRILVWSLLYYSLTHSGCTEGC